MVVNIPLTCWVQVRRVAGFGVDVGATHVLFRCGQRSELGVGLRWLSACGVDSVGGGRGESLVASSCCCRGGGGPVRGVWWW